MKLTGRYFMNEGKVVPDAGMREINRRVREFRLLEGSSTIPFLYFRPSDGTYWRYDETEDLVGELRQVTRRYLRRYFPAINPDRHHEVRWPPQKSDAQ